MPEQQWLDRDLVDALHEQTLRVHGGLAGVRDVQVLEAAIASARNLWAYEGGRESVPPCCPSAGEPGQSASLQRWQQTHRHHLGGGLSRQQRH
jgi:hypothetical protein